MNFTKREAEKISNVGTMINNCDVQAFNYLTIYPVNDTTKLECFKTISNL